MSALAVTDLPEKSNTNHVERVSRQKRMPPSVAILYTM